VDSDSNRLSANVCAAFHLHFEPFLNPALPAANIEPLESVCQPVQKKKIRSLQLLVKMSKLLLPALAATAGLLSACPCPAVPEKAESDLFEAQVRRICELTRYELQSVDEVKLAGLPARKATLARTTWELKSVPQSADLGRRLLNDVLKLPESERLKHMNRFDEYIEIWAAPESAGDSLRSRLKASEKPQRWYRELFYLGKDRGYAWYGDMTIYDFVNVEKALALVGDDLIAAEIRGCAVDDVGSATANSSEVLLGEEGAKALKAIDRSIAAQSACRDKLVASMYNSRDPLVVKWLVAQSQSTDAIVAAAARRSLLQNPRIEASDLYVKWLSEAPASRDVFYELNACLTVRAGKAGPYAERILSAPGSIQEYRCALELARLASGRPGIPESMLEQERQIASCGYQFGRDFDPAKVQEARDGILKNRDVEAAAAVGMTLALRTLKGGAAAINDAGTAILQQLPNGSGKKLAALLARTARAGWQTERILEIDRLLNEKKK
jgi:hypothetical protein